MERSLRDEVYHSIGISGNGKDAGNEPTKKTMICIHGD
jgi:hypothetical protein